MKISFKDIRPNPFRNLNSFPLDQQKVTELVSSIKATDAGFWDNVLVRKNGDFYELAYGHHRLEAARQAGLKEADFIVKKLTDDEMLKIMVLENRADLERTQVSILVEGVEALVNAIAAGTVAVKVDPKTSKDHIRNAPSFISGCSGDSPEHPYTIESVALFLNETEKRGDASKAVRYVVAALECAEKRIPGGLTQKEVEHTEVLSQLAERIKETGRLEKTRNEQKLRRERDEAALAEAAERTRKLEARRKEIDLKAKQDQKERDARIREEAEKLRIAQEDEDREKAKQAKARMEVERKQAAERQLEFEVKRAELDAKVEARKKEETERRRKIEDAETKRKGPVIVVEEKPVIYATDVLRHVHNAVENLRSALEKSRAIKTDDLLTLRRIKGEAEEAQKLSSRIFMKFQKA
jgi:hypothetical protein